MLIMADCLRCGCRVARDNGDAPFCSPCDATLEAEAAAAHRRLGPVGDGSCRAVTRRGTACEREVVTADGYCPSHMHLGEVA